MLTRRAVHEAERLGLATAPVIDDVRALVAALARQGLVDDGAYARGRARALLRRGRQPGRVRRELQADGLEGTLIDDALEGEARGAGDLERAAAVRYARRRGLGPFRAPEERALRRERDLRALVRQGVPFALARTVVDAPDALALDDLLA